MTQKKNWYVSLTFFEVLISGFFLFQARSLDSDSLFLGYSGARVALILFWMCLVLLSFVFLFHFYTKSLSYRAFAKKTVDFLYGQQNHLTLVEWLQIIATISWGVCFLFWAQPNFLFFIWHSLPLLTKQYYPILLLIGLWAAQSIFFLRGYGADFPKKDVGGLYKSIATKATLLFLLSFFLYAYTAVALDLATSSKKSYFPELADAFLAGRLDLIDPLSTKDLTLFDNKYYLSFPPLPALVMLPLVAWRGVSAVNVLLFNDIFAALAVVFIFLMLEAMRERGWSALHWKENATLALFAGFSSALYYLTTQPLVNLVSQVYAMAFLSLSLWLAFDNRLKGKMTGAFLAGSGLAIAILARPNMVFAWLLIVAIQIDEFYHEGNKTTQDLIKWGLFSGIPIAASVALLFWYNWARFGSGFDFGYEYMLVAERLKSDLSIYGQFHPHFIWRNFFDNFLRLPYLDAQCQKITPMPQGMSIFITSPLLIYLYRTFKKKIWVIGAWISISLIFITHILYYNSGALQYGYRFSLDFMPILVALLAFGFKKRIPRTGYILVIIGIAINIIGVLWSTHRWCINF